MMSRAAKGLRHMVMIGVKESTTPEQILAVKEGLAGLKETCGILDFEPLNPIEWTFNGTFNPLTFNGIFTMAYRA